MYGARPHESALKRTRNWSAHWPRKIVLGIWLTCTTLFVTATPAKSARSYLLSSAGSAADTTGVVLTLEQADSLYTALSRLETENTYLRNENKILQIDVWEAEQLAAIDVAFNAERVRMMRDYYKGTIADLSPPWYRKALTHPVVWFALGTYLGVRATQ